MNKLMSCLKEAGREPVALRDKALILPFGARVLGLYPAKEVNAFWVNDALSSPDRAAAFLEDPGWINLGGDRTWISPEVETHVKDPARMPESVEVPKAVDPGSYSITERRDTIVTLRGDMEVLFHRSRVSASLAVTKRIALLAPPTLAEGVSFAGYQMDVTLRPDASLPAGIRPALWNLIQVPGGGRIIAPIKPGGKPRPFFGPTPYSVENGRILCDVRTKTSFKFSVYARDSRGITAYLNTETSPALLVVRRFNVFDSSRYTDVPCDDMTDTGHVQQVYVDDGALGGFGEMEHHSPALGLDGPGHVTDHSETLSFAGPADALKETLENLIAEGIPLCA
jgi:hypothetical protein